MEEKRRRNGSVDRKIFRNFRMFLRNTTKDAVNSECTLLYLAGKILLEYLYLKVLFRLKFRYFANYVQYSVISLPDGPCLMLILNEPFLSVTKPF